MDGGPPCFPPGSSCPAVLGAARGEAAGSAYGALTLCGGPSHVLPLACRFVTPPRGVRPRERAPSTPAAQRAHAVTRPPVWAGAVPIASTPAVSVDFPSSGYLDVSVPPVAPRIAGDRPSPVGFPHSGTPGSKPECGSPGTIAASRALHRRPVPRHPPCALRAGPPLGGGAGSVPASFFSCVPVAMRLSRCPGRAPGAGYRGLRGKARLVLHRSLERR